MKQYLLPLIIVCSYILLFILVLLFNYGAHKFSVFHDDKYYDMDVDDERSENKDEK